VVAERGLSARSTAKESYGNVEDDRAGGSREHRARPGRPGNMATECPKRAPSGDSPAGSLRAIDETVDQMVVSQPDALLSESSAQSPAITAAPAAVAAGI